MSFEGSVYPKALSIKCRRSAHVDACRSRLLLSIPVKSSPCTYIMVQIHSQGQGHLGSFRFFPVTAALPWRVLHGSPHLTFSREYRRQWHFKARSFSHVHVSWEFHLVFPVHSPGTENSQWFTSSSYALSVGLFSLCQLGSTAELFSPGAGNGICCVLICICVFRSILVVERCPWEYLASGRWLLGNASSPCF